MRMEYSREHKMSVYRYFIFPTRISASCTQCTHLYQDDMWMSHEILFSHNEVDHRMINGSTFLKAYHLTLVVIVLFIQPPNLKQLQTLICVCYKDRSLSERYLNIMDYK